jgi:hypothetical protein
MRQNRKPRSRAHSRARTAWAVKPKVWGRPRRPKTPSNIEDKRVFNSASMLICVSEKA